MTISKSLAYAIIPIFVIALTIGFTITPSAFDVYADSEGYSGVGLRPTLGIDNRGYTLIEDGLTINGQTFKAEYFSQTIQTQTVKANQPIDITLHLFVKGGLNNLAHVSFVANNGEESKHIQWNQDFKGTQTVSVSDNEFHDDIKVAETILDIKSQTSDMNGIKSPLKQTRDGVSANNVKCDLGKKLMIKNNGTPICVSPASASKLVAMGWAKQA